MKDFDAALYNPNPIFMKMLKNVSSGCLLVSLCLVLLFTGCNGPAAKDQNVNQAVGDSIKKEIALSPESEMSLYNFPTPLEMAGMLEKAKAGYFFDITNSPDNIVKYNTEMSKALNLGIYSADLSYSVTYNRIDETNKFLACTSKLADELGIAGVYDKSLTEKVIKNKNNNEELIALINNLFRQSNDFLSKNNRNQVAVLIASGGFAEGVFLAASLAEVAVRDNSKIVAVIAAQKDNYDKLMMLLSAYNSDPEMKSLADNMAALQSVWTNAAVLSGKKVPMEETVKIADLAGGIRDKMVN